MMPPYYSAETPPGEVELFDTLATSSETQGWIVLHSLSIANHETLFEGEADFVVIVPERGILVLEVKSHLSVKRLDNGLWMLGQQAPSSRSPFRQASEAMYSIIRYLGDHGEYLRSTPVLSAVWFTHTRAKTGLPTSPEWKDWQVLDSEDKRHVAKSILKVLSIGANELRKSYDSHSSSGVGPSAELSLRVASLLRPRFEFAQVRSDLRRVRNSELVELIEEQFDALDAMAANERVLYTGAAGTGKTLLAVESARRESAKGEPGLLLCFNNFLGRQLVAQTSGIPKLRTMTFHAELLRIAGVKAGQETDQSFWQDTLPSLALESLLRGGGSATSSYLIVDEAQDLVDEVYLDVLDLVVKGGLSSGRVLFFGDFERQALYSSGHHQERLRSRIPDLATFNLSVNCRNLPRIGTVVNTFSRLDPGYRRYRRQDDGVDPELIAFKSVGEQAQLLVESIRRLKDEGFKLDEIVVLSPIRSDSAATTTEDPWLKQILIPEDGNFAKPGKLRFGTIHSFKGLEAPAVVLTDLNQHSAPGFEALLYIGLTRATDRLVCLMSQDPLQTLMGGA